MGLVPESDSDMYFWWKFNIPCPDCTAEDYERAKKHEEEVVIPRWNKFMDKMCQAGSVLFKGGFCFTQDDLKDMDLTDTDNDGLPDSIDPDDDNDGIPDDKDPYPKEDEACYRH